MNQAIQFPDREEWDADKEAVCFPALVNGMMLTCAISAKALAQRFGQGEAMALFTAHRWDIEDEAEAAIANEAFDDQEWVWLASAR